MTAASGDVISARGWAVLIATYLAYVCIYCARKPFSVVKSTVQKEQGLSSQELANIDTALLTFYAVGQLSLGLIVSLCGGRKRALVLAFLLAGAATAAFGTADSALPMTASWALAGLFAAPASPLFSIIVGESVPDKVRGTAIGIWSSCENLGSALANNVAAKALSSMGWRYAFFVSAPLVAVWSLVLVAVLPADSAPTEQKKEAKTEAPKGDMLIIMIRGRSGSSSSSSSLVVVVVAVVVVVVVVVVIAVVVVAAAASSSSSSSSSNRN